MYVCARALKADVPKFPHSHKQIDIHILYIGTKDACRPRLRPAHISRREPTGFCVTIIVHFDCLFVPTICSWCRLLTAVWTPALFLLLKNRRCNGAYPLLSLKVIIIRPMYSSDEFHSCRTVSSESQSRTCGAASRRNKSRAHRYYTLWPRSGGGCHQEVHHQYYHSPLAFTSPASVWQAATGLPLWTYSCTSSIRNRKSSCSHCKRMSIIFPSASFLFAVTTYNSIKFQFTHHVAINNDDSSAIMERGCPWRRRCSNFRFRLFCSLLPFALLSLSFILA